uniref:Apple domain-containing protein n=1 Tax=Clastoptera arizonana TaxID=38151 RepID=A0A1B6D9T9_9HEMI
MSTLSLTIFGIITTLINFIRGQGCGPGLLLTYVKMPDVVPRTAYTPTLLYNNVPGVAITAECYNRCQQQPECDGFMVDYRQGACFRVRLGSQHEDLIHTENVNFFRKVCLRVPQSCTTRAWPIVYTPNYELLGNQHTVVSNIRDKCVSINNINYH